MKAKQKMFSYGFKRKCSPVRLSPSYKSLRKVSVHWTKLRNVTAPLCTCALCRHWPAALLQTKAWRRLRLEGSVRRRAAARTLNFSAPHVSSSVFKAPISVHRYRNFSRHVGFKGRPKPRTKAQCYHEVANCQARQTFLEKR